MHERIRILKHKGKPIMLIDFSECAAQELLKLLDDVQRQVAKHPRNSLLTLADFHRAQIDKASATRIKEVLALDRPYVKRSAWVGTERRVAMAAGGSPGAAEVAPQASCEATRRARAVRAKRVERRLVCILLECKSSAFAPRKQSFRTP